MLEVQALKVLRSFAGSIIDLIEFATEKGNEYLCKYLAMTKGKEKKMERKTRK